jgi:AP-1-like factor
LYKRRRAQNRASQQAFRERKKKRIVELEEELTDLKGRYSDLDQSHKILQRECSAVRKELENLQRLNCRHDIANHVQKSDEFGIGELIESRGATLNPLLLDVSFWGDTTPAVYL